MGPRDDILLTRIDRNRNVARFYTPSMEPAPFGGFALELALGTIRPGSFSKLAHS